MTVNSIYLEIDFILFVKMQVTFDQFQVKCFFYKMKKLTSKFWIVVDIADFFSI